MKKILVMILLIPVLLFSLHSVYAATPPVNVSFVQMGHVAKFKLVNTKTNEYRLTLKRVNPLVTYFSDRPARVIGQLTNEMFLQKWEEGSDSFAKDAPNAVINGSVRDDHMKKHFLNIAMVLFAPKYDAKTQTFTYGVKLMQGNKSVPPILYHPVMFIDNACLTCVG